MSGSGISWAVCMQVYTLLQTENHASTPPLRFLQAGYPFCRRTNSVKALNALARWLITLRYEMLFNVRSKDDIYRTETTTKQCRPKTEKVKSKNGYAQK